VLMLFKGVISVDSLSFSRMVGIIYGNILTSDDDEDVLDLDELQ
jgi:hypothetical protein